jgi:integral membrane protein (TIGR00529 family)
MFPAIIRVLVVFLLILFAIRKKVSLGNALFFGAIVLGCMFGLSFKSMLFSVYHSITHPKTLALTIMVCLILVFSHSMEVAGQMQRLLDRYQGLIAQPRINLVVFPALIGLLPMPGGAIFSAPMVKTLGNRLNFSKAQLSFINYWFRHIWEYWWPLYPGVLLTTTLANLNLWVFVIFLFPLTSVALLLGYWILRDLKTNPQGASQNGENCQPRPPILPFIKELLPILIVICLGLTLGAVLTVLLKPYAISITKELGLVFSLLVAIGWVWHKNRLSTAQRWQILRQRQLLGMFYMVVAILVFKGMLEDSRAVEMISQELLHWHIPLMPICIILPFIVGGVVGITIAFVGTTFPILISLIQNLGEAQFMLPYMMLALASGFVGVLLSPLHLCLLLSNEYFQTSLGPVYRYLWLPSISLLIAACSYFFLLLSITSH